VSRGQPDGSLQPYSQVSRPGKNTEALIETNKEVGLVVNMEKTEYGMLRYGHQNAGQGNRSFGNVAQLKYLGMTVTNSNFINKEEIKMRLNLGNACNSSLHNLLSSHLCLKRKN
jgi:hypothetical protein